MIKLFSALAISLFLGFLGLYLIAPDALSNEALSVIRRLDAGALLAIGSPVLLWWLLSGWRISFLTERSSQQASLWQGIQTHLFGTLSAVATPAGGGNSIGIVFLLNRFGLPANEAVAVAVMCLVGDLAFFGWAAPAAYFALRLVDVNVPLEDLGILVALLSGIALLTSYLLVFRLPLAINLLRALVTLPLLRRFRSRSEQFLHRLELAGQQYSERPWHWHLRFHLLSSAARLPYFTVLNLVLIGLMVSAEHLVVYAAQIVLHAFAFLVPTPGASGYQEGAITYALRGHVGGRSLAAAVILWRIYQHYIYFLVGPLVGGLVLATGRKNGAVKEGE